MRKALILILCTLVLTAEAQFSGISQDSLVRKQVSTYKRPVYEMDDAQAVDSLIQSLNVRQKIGQLFMVAAYSNKGDAHVQEITQLVEDYGIGGLIFFQGGPLRQARLTNLYQSKADIPLMIAMDAEWGLAMRLDSTVKYPRQMALGAIQDESLIYDMGADLAEQCRRLGVHVNFAPVVDINNNPNNPVINSRSFGEDKELVANHGIAYMKGMQDNKVLACAKHFPGHGDTDTDSHLDLPVIKHDKKRLEEVEMYPFRKMIDAGIASMMIAHLNIPALDSNDNLASTLSSSIVQDLLVDELGFRGLKFTDALNMKGVSRFFDPGEVDLKAFLAGNDVLLFPEDVPLAIEKIEAQIISGNIDEAILDEKLRKILMAKKWLGLWEEDSIDIEGLYRDLNKNEYELTRRKLIDASLTLVKNNKELIPFKALEELKIAAVAIGDEENNAFHEQLKLYTDVKCYSISKNADAVDRSILLKKLDTFNHVIVSLHDNSQYPSRKFGFKGSTIDDLRMFRKKSASLVYFGNPYGLKYLKNESDFESILVTYHEDEYTQKAAAMALFGGLRLNGKLPVSANDRFPSRTGEDISQQIRFKYSIPEELGIRSEDLAKIDYLVNQGLEEQAFPGCQVLVAKDQKIFYHKAFGFHTYENKQKVKLDDLYDLASITKIAASTISFMKLDDSNKVSLDDRVCYYLEDVIADSSEYNDIFIRDMLAHQAGLKPYLPFYENTLVKGFPMYQYYSLAPSETYPNRVSDNLYSHYAIREEILNTILETPLNEKKEYKYSDLGYYFLQMIVESQAQQTLDKFAMKEFYKPLGMSTAGYLPRNRFSLDRIVPTEYDLYFRKKQVHGDVHDPGAALMGGVAGHAGVFSSANDLAKLMQMLNNWGEYGGKRYIQEQTVKEYTDCQFCEENRRGAGFDKPVTDGGPGPTCTCVSYASFGHTGFTGTIAWADPNKNLIYIFLSNRVYPDASNKKLIKMDIRTNIQQAIYDALPVEPDDSLSKAEE